MATNPPARVRNGADNTRGSCMSSPDWRPKIRTNLPWSPVVPASALGVGLELRASMAPSSAERAPEERELARRGIVVEISPHAGGGAERAVRGMGLVIALGVALVLGSVTAVIVPPSVLHRSVDAAQGLAEALLRVGQSAVERLGDVAKDVGRGVAATTQSAQAQGRVLSGHARVVDGDSLEVAGERIRLHGIDAPERAQTCRAGGARWRCGERATRRLRERIGGRTVACEERDRDRYGRVVAVCRAGGEDLNAWMVERGFALAYRRYSRAYVDEEAAAKRARRGLWRGDFVAPWDWRRGERLKGATVERVQDAGGSGSSGNCRIKGNVSRSGERIYHVPGAQHYERTRISTGKGERWFCSEGEARAAGWRKAKR